MVRPPARHGGGHRGGNDAEPPCRAAPEPRNAYGLRNRPVRVRVGADNRLGESAVTAARRWLEAALHPAAVPPGDDPSGTRLHVRGSICRAPGGRWLDWEGHQSFETEGLGFRWQARLRLARLAWVDAEDRLDAEGGYGGARLLGVIPVGSARGAEVTRLQLVRNLAELAFAPLAASGGRGLVWAADGRPRLHPRGPWDRRRRNRASHRR